MKNSKRKYVSRVDKLLHENAIINASLGIDSTKKEVSNSKKEIRKNVRKIKELCPYTYSIIEVDDNHKSTN
tara:strand:+ start:281 stop:493 length:213 start_codon:yes stop_codon:yes gene_type:complete